MKIKSITIHSLEPDLYTALVSQARAHDTSLNRIAKAMLRTAAGLTDTKKNRDLSWIKDYQWTKRDAKAFDKTTRDTERIFPGDW